MEDATHESTNLIEQPPTAEEEVGQTQESTLEAATDPAKDETNPPNPETNPPKDETPGMVPLSPEMKEEIQRLLRNTNRGRGLMVRLDAIARPDLYKNSSNVNWVRDIQAIDIQVRPYDCSPGIFEQFRAYCWNNAMAYRFDDSSGFPVLVVRWYLVDVLPVTDPEFQAHAMAAPKKKPIPDPPKPGLKEVK